MLEDVIYDVAVSLDNGKKRLLQNKKKC